METWISELENISELVELDHLHCQARGLQWNLIYFSNANERYMWFRFEWIYRLYYWPLFLISTLNNHTQKCMSKLSHERQRCIKPFLTLFRILWYFLYQNLRSLAEYHLDVKETRSVFHRRDYQFDLLVTWGN